MSAPTTNGQKWRNNPFSRDPPSPSPGPSISTGRPNSMAFISPPSTSNAFGHHRNQSFSPPSGSNLASSRTTLLLSNSSRSNSHASNTFAPKFIKTDESQRETELVRGIEGENDFSGKRYVWVRDAQVAFIKGWVVDELDGDRLMIQCDDGTVRYWRVGVGGRNRRLIHNLATGSQFGRGR